MFWVGIVFNPPFAFLTLGAVRCVITRRAVGAEGISLGSVRLKKYLDSRHSKAVTEVTSRLRLSYLGQEGDAVKHAFLFLLISPVLFCHASCELFGDNSAAVVEDLTAIPADWIAFDADGKFTFMGPPSLEQQEITGIDSFVGYYHAESIDVVFDYGRYSPEVACSRYVEYITCRLTESEIDGRAARVLIGTRQLPPSLRSYFGGPILYSTQLRIDEVAEDPYGKIDLFFRADSPEMSDTTWLKMIIYSVKISEG